MKSKNTALILSILLGGLGIDRFYLGYTGMGVVKLLTGGGLGIIWILDIINIATGKLRPADGFGYSEDYAPTMPPTPKDSSPVSSNDAYDQLVKIADLHKQGIMNDEEFEKKKAELLEKM